MTKQEIKKLIYEQQTKLAPSKITGAGIGVFALVDIPKDTLIKGCKAFMEFSNMESEFVFRYDEFEDLNPAIQKYVYIGIQFSFRYCRADIYFFVHLSQFIQQI